VYFDGGSKASFCCSLRHRWKKLRDLFGLCAQLPSLATSGNRDYEAERSVVHAIRYAI